jgi:hypothetical protein
MNVFIYIYIHDFTSGMSLVYSAAYFFTISPTCRMEASGFPPAGEKKKVGGCV